MFDAEGEATFSGKPKVYGLNIDSRLMGAMLRVRMVSIAARMEAQRLRDHWSERSERSKRGHANRKARLAKP